jgi:MFS family permease
LETEERGMAVEPNRLPLAIMMFGQYQVMGAWAVTLATYLLRPLSEGGLAFPANYTGWIYSTFSIAGIISPLFVGLLADRLFAAQKVMGVLHLLGVIFLVGMGIWCDRQHPELLVVENQLHQQVPEEIENQSGWIHERPEWKEAIRGSFLPLFAMMVVYANLYLLTTTLCTVVALRNLLHPREQFGTVRLWGTIAWMVMGYVVAFLLNPISSQPLYLAAFLSLVMGIGSFWLPDTPPTTQGRTLSEAFGIPALKLFRERAFCILLGCGFIIAMSQQFYNIFANPYLQDLHSPKPAAVQTIAQIGEVLAMAYFPFIIPRLRYRTMLMLGITLLFFRNFVFTIGGFWFVILFGLPLHGLGYAFFYIILSLYVDRRAPDHLRASAQGIVTVITLGVGNLLGNLMASNIVANQQSGKDINWTIIWGIPTLMCLIVAIIFYTSFKDRERPGDPK